MKKPLIILGLILITKFSVHAQFEIGFTGIPSISKFNISNTASDNAYFFPISYGLNFNYHHERFMLSSGLLHMTQGRKFESEKISEEYPEGNGDYIDMYFRAKSIMIPLIANSKFIKTSKATLFSGIGMYLGYNYSQELENTSIPEDPTPSRLNIIPNQRFTEWLIFNDFYFGLNLGIGWNQNLTDKLSLQLRPNFLYQIRREESKSTNAWTNRMMTFALDIGMYYKI